MAGSVFFGQKKENPHKTVKETRINRKANRQGLMSGDPPAECAEPTVKICKNCLVFLPGFSYDIRI